MNGVRNVILDGFVKIFLIFKKTTYIKSGFWKILEISKVISKFIIRIPQVYFYEKKRVTDSDSAKFLSDSNQIIK